MNILFPISPNDGLGQPSSALTGSVARGEGDAFAEALTAVLAASTVPGVRPNQQHVATPLGHPEGSPIEAAPQAGETKVEGIYFVGEGQPGHGATTSDDVIAGAASETTAFDTSFDASTADKGVDQPPAAHDIRGLITKAGVDGAQITVESPKIEAPTAAKAESAASSKPSHSIHDLVGTEAERAVDHPPRKAGAPINAALAATGDQQPSDHMADWLQNSAPGSEAGLKHPTPLDPTRHDPTPLGSIIHEPADPSLPETPSTSSVVDQNSRPTRPAVPLASTSQAVEAGSGLPTAVTAGPESTKGSPPLDFQHRERARPVGDMLAKPVDVSAQTGLTHLPGALTAPRPPAGSRQTAPTIDALTNGPLVETAGISRPTNTENSKNRPEGSPATILGAKTRPAPTGAVTDPAAQAAIVEAGARQNTELDGANRFQHLLVTEGDVLDGERFGLLNNTINAAKGTAPSFPTPASAQIAMQIVRSVPDGVDRLSLHLHPAELGSVDIQLRFEEAGRLSAVITAERPETLELLQRDSRLLERSLGDSGLKLSGDGLSFELKQDQQQQQPGQNFQEQAQARQIAHQAGRAYDDASDVEQVPLTRRIDGLRLLDIQT